MAGGKGGRKPRPGPARPEGQERALHEKLRSNTSKLQNLLEETRTRYFSLFDMAPIGYVVVDDEGVIQALNLTMASLVGQPRGVVVGTPMSTWISPEDRNLHRRHIRACQSSSASSITCDVTLVGSGNKTVEAHLITRRVAFGRGLKACLSAVIDVSERHRVVKALRSRETNLHAAALRLEAGKREAERASAKLRSLAREMNRAEQRERERIARLLHDELQQLLVSAKIRLRTWHDRDRRDPKHAEVVQLLDQAIASSRSLTAQLSPPVLQEAGLEAGLMWLARWTREQHSLVLDLDLDEETPDLAFDDRAFLFEAARELVFNALKHADVRQAKVHLLHTEGKVRLEVSDEGKGFDVATLNPEGRPGHLGLFSLRERIGLMGGSLDVQSAPGTGTMVRLDLPVVLTRPATRPVERPAARQRAAAVRVSREGVVRVLVVDDHRLVREGIQSFLSEEPWLEIVGEAGDGMEAVAKARELQPDVVIMDVTLPRMSGIEATRAILDANPGMRVIALSMHEHEDMAAAMLAAGAERYLPKGGPAEDLIEAVRRPSQRTAQSPAQ